MKIPPEAWKRVDPLLEAALDLAQADRPEWLREQRARTPDLAPMLESLLSMQDRIERTGNLDTVPRFGPVPPAPSAFTAGEPVGPFRLLRALGRGGMGEVWLAEQADGRLTRRVALKLPTILEARQLRAERFARERDILALLEHPNIARLYDAGATPQGQPWLAVEYVEGAPLDQWLRERALSRDARAALFRQVLAAVAHAHRHLVVHRDIKPANILVDTAGSAKLLDFGIAKLVGPAPDDAALDLTRAGGRAMTLRYAAPEQVAAEPVTTATDIYSLGVVLYEMLAGASPYAAAREGRTMNEATLLQEEVALASAIAQDRNASRSLSGDLDAILLKALRRDPAERYATVEQFDDDLRRHLANFPVLARGGTWRYLAGRFARRHRASLAIAGVVLVAVTAGGAMVERERRAVLAQKERAERHLASVRSLSNSLMFEVHDQLSNVPGSMKARQTLADSAGRYLERIAPEAGDAPAFRREFAAAWFKLGNIQGQYGFPNLGQPELALANYDRALALLSPPSPATQPESAELYVRVQRYRGQLLHGSDRWDEAIAAFRAGREVAEALARAPRAAPERRIDHAIMIVEDTWRRSIKEGGDMRVLGLEEGLAIVRTVAGELPPDAPEALRNRLQEDTAWMTSQMGHVLRNRPDPADKRRAVGMFGEALAAREAALQRSPGNVDARRSVAAHHTFLGLTHADLGEYETALGHAAKAADGMEALAAADPVNLQYRRDAHFVRAQLAYVDLRAGRPAQALATLRKAREQERELSDSQRQAGEFVSTTARARLTAAEAGLRVASSAPRAERAAHLAAAGESLAEADRASAELEKRGGWEKLTREYREWQAQLEGELAAVRAAAR